MSSTRSKVCSGRPVTWVWTGDLDAGDTAALKEGWRSILGQHPRRITIDMAAVTFLDCAVVSFLLTARRQAGTRLVLHPVPPVAARLFQWTALTDVLAPSAQRPPPPPPPSRPVPATRPQPAAV